MAMANVALGVIVLNRVDKLERLLNSAIGKCINIVYIADNGKPSDEKEKLYTKDYPFELDVLQLDYDIGLGRCRNQIVDRFDEDYLLMADSDHELSNNIEILLDILQVKDSVGGVAGSLIEPADGRIWQSAKDFRMVDGILAKGNAFQSKEIEIIDGNPFAAFDFIPYPTLYKAECLEDYAWDNNIKINFAHDDFYVHHWRNTDWKFGIAPEVCFRHYPGGNSEYASRKRDSTKRKQSKEYFLSKWSLRDFRTDGGYWYDTRYRRRSRPLYERAKETYSTGGLVHLVKSGISKCKYNIKKQM